MPVTYEPNQPCTIIMPDGTYYDARIVGQADMAGQWIIELDKPTPKGKRPPLGRKTTDTPQPPKDAKTR